MTGDHPLDFPAWSALTGRQAQFAITRDGARRFDPAIGVFAGVAERDEAGLSALGNLISQYGDVALLEAEGPPPIPGVVVVSTDLGVQMVEVDPAPIPAPDFEVVDLTDDDAPQMLALAHLTKPGPFFQRTHQLGEFIGVKIDGRLAAMAGERMKPEGHTEVSGVCVHPDFRGRGYAAALTQMVGARIRARGETAFLHAYAHNTPAITLYERLGYRLRRNVLMMRLGAA
jgi:ribosomal protein S18 acetylase RimI-like enzyme